MNILGYILQVFHEDRFLPDTGYKHLYKHYSQALDSAKARVNDYTGTFQDGLVGPFEIHTPSKKQVDADGYAIIFRNSELQVWIEVIIE